jgi:hypothetical protein
VESLLLMPFCLIGVVFVAALVFVVVLISRRRRPYTAEESAQAEAAAKAHLDQTAPSLSPWNPTALADLACQWEGRVGGLSIGQYEGRMMSLSQPDLVTWLSFSLSLKGSRGFLRLRTSVRELCLEIGRGGFRLTVDGQLLGSLRERDSVIFDSSAQPVGRYQRYRGARWQMGSHSLSSRYGPVEFRGRRIAELNDALDRSGGLFRSGAAQRPLVRLLEPSLTGEEENWLLALVALELYYSAQRYRSRQMT